MEIEEQGYNLTSFLRKITWLLKGVKCYLKKEMSLVYGWIFLPASHQFAFYDWTANPNFNKLYPLMQEAIP